MLGDLEKDMTEEERSGRTMGIGMEDAAVGAIFLEAKNSYEYRLACESVSVSV